MNIDRYLLGCRRTQRWQRALLALSSTLSLVSPTTVQNNVIPLLLETNPPRPALAMKVAVKFGLVHVWSDALLYSLCTVTPDRTIEYITRLHQVRDVKIKKSTLHQVLHQVQGVSLNDLWHTTKAIPSWTDALRLPILIQIKKEKADCPTLQDLFDINLIPEFLQASMCSPQWRQSLEKVSVNCDDQQRTSLNCLLSASAVYAYEGRSWNHALSLLSTALKSPMHISSSQYRLVAQVGPSILDVIPCDDLRQVTTRRILATLLKYSSSESTTFLKGVGTQRGSWLRSLAVLASSDRDESGVVKKEAFLDVLNNSPSHVALRCIQNYVLEGTLSIDEDILVRLVEFGIDMKRSDLCRTFLTLLRAAHGISKTKRIQDVEAKVKEM
eukprot:PhF_6_TR9465/c0_g1_i1/m.14785